MSLIAFRKAWIIGVALLLAVAGCSTLRLGYGNGGQLAWWWLDGYMDFGSEQTPRVRQAVDRWFAWHRTTQLPDYADLLSRAAAALPVPTTAQEVCRWQAEVLDRLRPALDQALVEAAGVLPTLGERQWRHLEQRYAKMNAERRDEYLQPDPGARLKASVKRALDRAESLYGRLDEPQRRVVADGVATSPFDPELWLAEREARQREILQTLRRAVAERQQREQVLAALRALVVHIEISPRSAYRAYAERLESYNCTLAAQLHNATTAAQRQRAVERLKGWEDDLRVLAALQP